MLTSWSVFFRSWQVILQIFKVPSLRRGHFGIDAEGAVNSCGDGPVSFRIPRWSFRFAANLSAYQSQKRHPTDGFESQPTFPTNLMTCIGHTEETKAQSSIHDDCTVDHEMCSAMHGFPSYKPEQDLCATFCHPTRTCLPPWRKPVQLVQRHKCRHGQVTEDDWKQKKECVKRLRLQPRKTWLSKSLRWNHVFMQSTWRGMRRDRNFPLHWPDMRRIRYWSCRLVVDGLVSKKHLRSLFETCGSGLFWQSHRCQIQCFREGLGQGPQNPGVFSYRWSFLTALAIAGCSFR